MKTHRLALIGFIFALLGCASGDDLELSVDDSGFGFEDIRARLPITIEAGPTGFEGVGLVMDGPCNTTDCSPENFSQAILRGCAREETPGRATGTCQDRVVEAEVNVCTAHKLLEIIDFPGPREVFISDSGDPNYGTAGTVLLPAQDAESEAELARLAAYHGSVALGVAADSFDTALVPSCANTVLDDPAGTGTPLSTLTVAEEFAHFYGEGLQIIVDATDRFEELGAAVSDAAYARRPGGTASAAALAPFASRTAAAHWLVGGATALANGTETGLPAISTVSTHGFFTRPRLSGEAQRALELFRAAALNPDQILSSTITIDQLIASGGPVLLVNSLKFRLGHMQHREALRFAATADVAYGLLGVSRDGLTEAREYLREEIQAFDRSPAAILPAERLPAPGTTTATHGIVLYAATRTPPQQLLPSYWAAVLRYDPTPVVQYLSTSFSWGSPPPWEWRPHRPGLGGSEYFVAGDTWGQELLSSPPTAGQPYRAYGRRSYASVVD